MELTDGAIVLRPPTDADADRVAENVRHSFAELTPFMPWATADHDREKALAWINGEYDSDEQSFVILADGVIVGNCGLNRFDEGNRFANLGYWVRTDATGRGYATAATRLLARYGIEELGLARVEIFMSVENEASRRVAEKAGAWYEGTMRRRLLLHGRQHDAHLYSITADDLVAPGERTPREIDPWKLEADAG